MLVHVYQILSAFRSPNICPSVRLSIRPDQTGPDCLLVCPSAHLGWTGPDQAVCACVAMFAIISVAILFKFVGIGSDIEVHPPIGPDRIALESISAGLQCPAEGPSGGMDADGRTMGYPDIYADGWTDA